MIGEEGGIVNEEENSQEEAAPSGPTVWQLASSLTSVKGPGVGLEKDKSVDKLEPDAGEERTAVSRRHFLASLAVMGAAVGIGTQVIKSPSADAALKATTAPATTKAPLPQWTMVMDLRYCNGCNSCTTACQFTHVLPKDIEWIKVYTMQDANGEQYYLPRLCQMCEDPPCQAVCPVGATFRNDEGIVLIDQNACIGCRTCMAACPYESRYFNSQPTPSVPRQPFPPSPEWPVPQQMNTVGKCVLCAADLSKGKLPSCAEACGMGAIYLGDLTSDVAVNSRGNVVKLSQFVQENDAVHLKEELGTNPRVWYIPGHGQDYKESY
ncbi:MAG: 4Fe-4S dicluster domain-containing protein [Actinomycetota bacterium]|nr:MAG: 4Fe-4S dicluster domain-containing protein [Actinomycetota bacterium]